MSVNGIGSSPVTAYTGYETTAKAAGNTKAGSETQEAAAVYESSSKSGSVQLKNKEIIAKLKADTNNRVAQMQTLVEQMFAKQGIAIANTDEMWRKLASGDFTADAETIAQAKEDISEDGYWGVKQTSERIFDFALALSGGDKEKMEEMKEAVEKGFKEATKTWGKELPSITEDTHEAINKKFEDWFAEN